MRSDFKITSVIRQKGEINTKYIRFTPIFTADLPLFLKASPSRRLSEIFYCALTLNCLFADLCMCYLSLWNMVPSKHSTVQSNQQKCHQQSQKLEEGVKYVQG